MPNDIIIIIIIVFGIKSLLHKVFMSVKNCSNVNENERGCAWINRLTHRDRLRWGEGERKKSECWETATVNEQNSLKLI